jgi:hypothetical protein
MLLLGFTGLGLLSNWRKNMYRSAKLLASTAIALMPLTAHAQVMLTSDVTSVPAGGTITFDLVIPAPLVPNPSVPYSVDSFGDKFFSHFDGGGATFNSGDGQIQITGMGAFGLSDVAFTYLTPGDYTASVSGLVSYNTLACYTGSGCSDLLNGGTAPGSMNFTAYEDITVTAVPEPSTWAMMLLGFAGLGFAFRQSRRKVSLA